ncbi:MAG: response regulator transcription factor [Dehalococcoidales bacterium]|nr:response regulator transcription factor [Dehalococcoidales bacterium]
MSKQVRVLIVDDEPRIVKFLQVKLKSSGYEVLSAGSGKEALELVQAQEPDIVVLDIVMPGMDGLETLKQIRTVSGVPVIILSARRENAEKIKGLKLGADDYLAKPFSPDELVARIEAIGRRMVSDDQRKTYDEFSIDNLTVHFNSRTVTIGDKEIHLTRIEWLLLSELVQNAGSLMLYSDLLTRIWGPEFRDDVQILRTWISRLRNKIETNPGKPTIIRTIPKTGYIIENSVN